MNKKRILSIEKLAVKVLNRISAKKMRCRSRSSIIITKNNYALSINELWKQRKYGRKETKTQHFYLFPLFFVARARLNFCSANIEHEVS